MTDLYELVKGYYGGTPEEVGEDNFNTLLALLQSIRLEGWKQGMTDAAEICAKEKTNSCDVGFASQWECEFKILEARDNKTSV